MNPDLKVEAHSRYIQQQLTLATTWTVISPIQYPNCTIYLTQIRSTVLSQPTKVQATKEFIDPYTLQIIFTEPCLGFVVVN